MVLNPFHYSLAQLQVAITALVVAVISIVAFFVAFDPSFQVAAVVVVGEAFAVVGVFAAKEHTWDDVTKTVMALIGGVIAFVGYIIPGGVDPNTAQVIVGIATQLLLVGGVLFTTNSPAPTEAR